MSQNHEMLVVRNIFRKLCAFVSVDNTYILMNIVCLLTSYFRCKLLATSLYLCPSSSPSPPPLFLLVVVWVVVFVGLPPRWGRLWPGPVGGGGGAI